jgi:hypothetical protein
MVQEKPGKAAGPARLHAVGAAGPRGRQFWAAAGLRVNNREGRKGLAGWASIQVSVHGQ